MHFVILLPPTSGGILTLPLLVGLIYATRKGLLNSTFTEEAYCTFFWLGDNAIALSPFESVGNPGEAKG